MGLVLGRVGGGVQRIWHWRRGETKAKVRLEVKLEKLLGGCKFIYPDSQSAGGW